LTTKCELSDAIEIDVLEVFENAKPSINWTFWGIVIDLREEQEQNTLDSMCVNSESGSNKIEESDSQYEKHSEQRIWTWRGIVIDSREEQEQNTLDSMRVNSESGSNKIEESDSQSEKHFEQRIWTWRGIVIDLR
jgi:hypothetical protein